MNTLPKPYYDKMIGNVMQNFTEMVWSGELIEHGIKNKKIKGKVTATPKKKTTLAKKKEGEPIRSLLTNSLRDMHHMPANPLTLQVTSHLSSL